MNPQPKTKPIRLKGKALDSLHHAIMKRDRNLCVVCGRPADLINPWPAHHIKYRSQGGDDSIDNMISVCPMCHAQIHLHCLNGTVMGSKQATMDWLFERIK